MRWDRSHQSPDVEDRRGAGGGFGGGAGIGLLLPLLGRFGWRGILIGIAALFVVRYMGVCDGQAPSERGVAQRGSAAPDDELSRFVGFVLDDTQTHWRRAFGREDRSYEPARLVLFEGGVSSSCGRASSAVGPFYCPLDRRVYIDLSFYRQLQTRFGAPGDFAQAYVIAHEIGHHVQNLHDKLGRGESSGRGSIATELQADCLAGVWARDAEKRELLEAGDLREGMTAAAAVGDDAIQRQTEGDVRPETWTHGSSEQRKRAFRRGYDGGDLDACGL
jgi:hypothetical protein